MSSRRLMQCLLSQKPYFGPALRALQGVPKRHAYLHAVVELLSKETRTGCIKILEVGTWAGASAITWAKALQQYFGAGQVVCVDQWQPYFDTKINTDSIYKKMNEAAADGSIYSLFLHNVRTSNVSSIILPLTGASRNVLPELKKQEFSVVYLDGSHAFTDVLQDIHLSLDLVEEGGIICGDDLELQASQVGLTEVTKDTVAEKDYVKSEICGAFYHPGVTRAVAEVFGEVSVWEGFWAMRKTSNGWSKVDLSDCKIEVPEHISTAEYYPPVPTDDRSRLIFPINQIAEQLTRSEQESRQQTENTPKLLGSYCGFNVIKFGKYYYGVRQSVGEIDWSLPELNARFSESDVFRSVDKYIVLYRIGMDELLAYIEELSSASAEAMLRYEGLVGRGHPVGFGHQTELIREDYRGFSLIAFEGGVWAVRAGSVTDLHDIRKRNQLLAERQLLEAMTLEGAVAAVDQFHDRQAMDAAVPGLTSRFERIASQSRSSTDARLCELEQLVTQHGRAIGKLDDSYKNLRNNLSPAQPSGFLARFKRWIRLLLSRDTTPSGKE